MPHASGDIQPRCTSSLNNGFKSPGEDVRRHTIALNASHTWTLPQQYIKGGAFRSIRPLCPFLRRKDVLRLNTSMLGRVTLNTSKTSSSLLNSIGNSIKGDVNDLIGDIARKFNIHDFYSAHLLDYCEGYYTPSAFANATAEPHKNVTQCSNRTALFHFDPSSVIQKELKPGITLDDLHWPSAIKNAVRAVEIASKVMFVLYCIGAAATGLALLGAFLGVLSGGRLAALSNNMLAFLAFMALGIASAIASAIMSKVVDEVNKHGTDVGVTAARGKTFLGLTWTATVLMFITAIAWIYEFVAHRRQQTTYVYEGKKGRY
ncbi:MAG: hypothetical protein Q9228_005556 [Teloschistes exilis]